jgi:prepilin signal peptidase PulO-like enzyme (type II secretory pathway)
MQGGRCRACSAAISPAYPLMELSAAGIALWAWWAAPPAAFIFSCVLGWLLLALSAIDVRTRRLPDALNLLLALTGLSAALMLDRERMLEHVAGTVAGFAGIVVVEMAYRALRKRDGIGRGDAKLMGALGAWIGIKSLAGCLLLAASGAITAILLASWLSGRKLTPDVSVPFGPFLAAAGWVTWLYGITLI